jgi:hypothetical protein
MTKNLPARAAAALFLGLTLGAGHAETINFDNFTAGSVLAPNTFDSLGVHFDQHLLVADGNYGDFPRSPSNDVINNDSFGGDITGHVAGPLQSWYFISVWAGDKLNDVDFVTLNGYNAQGQLVATDSFNGKLAQTLMISGAGMVRFEILQHGTLIGIDNFRFHGTPVPEPTTLALMLGGLAAVGGAARARRKG